MAMGLIEQLRELERDGAREIEAAGDATELERLRVELLGRKGRLTAVLRQLGAMSPEERPAVGAEGRDL
jgi:phenylalanyl-tRNA synthetase alpha chain